MARDDAERWLDHHYIAARYPNAFPAGTPTDFYDEDLAATAHTDARAVVAYARGQVEEASPDRRRLKAKP